MPSEAYSAVYWPYFAVRFIVQGREQMIALKDSTWCPSEQLPLLQGKGQPSQRQSRVQGTARDHQKRKGALEKRLQGLSHMKR